MSDIFDGYLSTANDPPSPPIDTNSASQTINKIQHQRRKGRRSLHYVRPSHDTFTYPKSQYDGWKPPVPLSPEHLAIEDLKAEWIQDQRFTHRDQKHIVQPEEHVTFCLQDFKIYRPNMGRKRDFELEPLNLLSTKAGVNDLLFDGVLTVGNVQKYVIAGPFKILSIEGYGDHSLHTVARNVYIQSLAGASSDIWYRLGIPASEYRRYHEHFLWLADFAKHFVDYLIDHSDVVLDDFRSKFYDWIMDRHANNIAFLNWLSKYGRTDFRVAVSANVEFLYNESFSVNDDFYNAPIWDECAPWRLSAIKEQELLMETTIASPRVYECFKRMYFGRNLEMRSPVDKVALLQQNRQGSLGFVLDSRTSSASLSAVARGSKMKAANTLRNSSLTEPSVGDVVGIKRDIGTRWKDSTDIWLAYVQRTYRNREGELLLDIIWLYHPTDTIIFTMTYPIENELFLSNHCNCGHGEPPIKASEVFCQPSVDWSPEDLDTQKDYIVRQKYDIENNSFVSLKDSDKVCDCYKPRKTSFEKTVEEYKLGDCAYIFKHAKESTSGQSVLEPVVIVGFVSERQEVTVRGLIRRARDCADLDTSSVYCSRRYIRPNELVWTNQIFNVCADLIYRKCHIRFYTAEDVEKQRIPAPYNRDGAVDCFYIRSSLTIAGGVKQIRDLKAPFPLMNEGLDPHCSGELPMNGLSMFSGGGNFDRGLEECAAVKFCTAVDISKVAVHTWLANSQYSTTSAIYWGSVDDYLMKLLDGVEIENIAKIGQLEFISAGSPCPGFSPLQKDKLSAKSLRNASHVTSFASFVDLYRPKYAILENVVHMAYNMKGLDKENVFSQLIGCLVAMGYQVQQFLIDGWSYGSSQKRSRLFVSIAAPGLVPLQPPPLTHSHPSRTPNRSLGKLPNGEYLGRRQFNNTTPFKFVSAEESTKDLPMIGDSRVQGCISFPDHRNIRVLKSFERSLITVVPQRSTTQTFMNACRANVIPEPFLKARDRWSKHRSCSISKSWSRIDPLGLFATVTTQCDPADAFVGRVLHWEEHRVMTIQEARRAQGIPDDEVILGTLGDQWKVIGNGVDRHAALALGMSLREAWLSNPANTSFNSLQAGITSHTIFESDNSGPTLINRLKKIASAASRFMGDGV